MILDIIIDLILINGAFFSCLLFNKVMNDETDDLLKGNF